VIGCILGFKNRDVQKARTADLLN